VGPQLESKQQWHVCKLLVWNATNLENVNRTDDGAVTMALTSVGIDHWFE
jgi:hypothetical protein